MKQQRLSETATGAAGVEAPALLLLLLLLY
jgi:hypothetical protein